jgi:hypothetical protein
MSEIVTKTDGHILEVIETVTHFFCSQHQVSYIPEQGIILMILFTYNTIYLGLDVACSEQG